MPATAAVESLPAVLARAVETRPEAAAMIGPRERITWAELADAAHRHAAALCHHGIGSGENAAIWLPNGVDWLVAYWGASLNGSRIVPLSTRARGEEVARLLGHARAAALFTTARFEPLDLEALLACLRTAAPAGLRLLVVRGGVAEHGAEGGGRRGGCAHRRESVPRPARPPAVRTLEWRDYLDAAEGVEPAGPAGGAADEIHLIQYTSGTTGRPKGAMLTAAGLLRAAREHAASWGLAPGDAVFVPNPLSHILGLVYGILMPASAGLTTLTLEAFSAPEALAMLAEHGAAAMTGAPTHFQMLAEAPELDRFDLSSLRLGFTGGAAMDPGWVRRVTERLGLRALLNGYGMSEVGSIAQTRRSDPPEVLAASVGYPVAGLAVKVVDPETGAEQPPGQAGELWVRGPSVMQGYWREAELTAAALTDDGWLRTGDLLRRDDDGRLYFAGRRTAMFTVGGFNVHPAEVERILRLHPAVAEACVLGVPDERLGAVPVGFVEDGGAGVDAKDVIAHCERHLRGYMVPRRLEIVDRLPMNAAGKVDRRRLAALAAERWLTRRPAVADPAGGGG